MNITIAIDSLKGSLTSLEAGHAAAEGMKRVFPHAQIQIRPLADGGEGTVEALIEGMGGEFLEAHVTGPLGEARTCTYGILKDGKTAVIEMADVAGLPLVPEEKRNPMETTTYGVGEVIQDAIKRGCRHFLIGIGGSATNDGGAGMLQALGFGLLDKNGEQIEHGAKGLSKLAAITEDGVMKELKECTFRIACDVNNPLCGKLGASAVYGPQKGATKEMVQQMDQWLGDFGKLAMDAGYHAQPDHPGTGAAGGMGFACLTFLNAILEPGVKIILEETKLEDYIKNADIVVTGEGRLDAQTVMGKAPIGVARLAKTFHKPVIAFSGCISEGATACNAEGIDAYFPILRTPQTVEEAMNPETARKNMIETSEQVFRLIHTICERTTTSIS